MNQACVSHGIHLVVSGTSNRCPLPRKCQSRPETVPLRLPGSLPTRHGLPWSRIPPTPPPRPVILATPVQLVSLPRFSVPSAPPNRFRVEGRLTLDPGTPRCASFVHQPRSLDTRVIQTGWGPGHPPSTVGLISSRNDCHAANMRTTGTAALAAAVLAFWSRSADAVGCNTCHIFNDHSQYSEVVTSATKETATPTNFLPGSHCSQYKDASCCTAEVANK